MCDLPLPPPRRISFVELLIAIGIGGLLLAVVVPAYRSATFEADLAKCRSNLHQVGAALRYYAADNEGQFPPVVLGQTPGNPVSMFYTNVGSGDPNSDARGVGYLVGRPNGYGDAGYLQSWSPLYCPSQGSYPHPEPGAVATNVGFLATWIVEHDSPPDSWTRANWTNTHVYSNPLMPILMDFGFSIFPPGSAPTIPSHPRNFGSGSGEGEPSGYINSLHVGGHVTTRSLDDANKHTNLGALVRFLGTGVIDPRPL